MFNIKNPGNFPFFRGDTKVTGVSQ